MSTIQRNRFWNAFRMLAMCFVIASLTEQSLATLDFRCKDKACQKGTACETSPCKNGTCIPNGKDKYLCVCPPGYTGKNCQQTLCEAYPCKTGQLCSSSSKDPFVRLCLCNLLNPIKNLPIINKLLNCDDDPDIDAKVCDQNYCANGGTCRKLKDSVACLCANGWTGTDCSVGTSKPSAIGAQNPSGIDVPKASTIDVPNPSEIDPPKAPAIGAPNTSGIDVPKAPTIDDPNPSETELYSSSNNNDLKSSSNNNDNIASNDNCASSPCVHGTCTSSADAYQCTCNSGWMGQNCDVADYCYSNPCVNGTCTNGASSFVCTCNQDWSGNTCNIYNYCKSNPCQNQGTCSNTNTGFSCCCTPDCRGDICDSCDGAF